MDIVLNGHDHDYQRFVPLDANLNPASDGITEFVDGTGGQGVEKLVDTYDSRLVTTPAIALTYGAMRFELYNGYTNFKFIDTTGTTKDSGTINCHHSGPPYDISGTVTLPGGGGLAGVTVALNGQSAVTDADGKYTIYSLPDGTAGDLTPSKDEATP